MVAVPGDTPKATPPEVMPMVQTAVLLLVHVPPEIAAPRMVEVPTQVTIEPVSAGMVVETVTTTDLVQPVANV